MASEYLLSPLISSIPLNSNVGFNNSWIGVKNPFGLPFFAQLTYVTNLDDLVLEIDDLEELTERTNTLLEVLTSFGLQELTYLDKLTSLAQEIENNTDLLEPLIIESNTLLNSLTSIQVDKQNQLIALGHSLTSIQVDKQDQLISLGHSLTGIQVDKQDQLISLAHSLTGIQVDKQSQIITLLHQLTANTDELEINTDDLEDLLHSLTGIQVDKQNQLISLAHSLTGIQVDKQSQIITLLHQLTANTDELEINTDDLEDLLHSLTGIQVDKQNQLIALSHSLTGIQVDKQNQLIALSHSLTSISNRIDSNTDHLENLLIATNDYLNIIIGWDYSTATKQDELYLLLNIVKDIIIDKQDQLIALGHSLTSIQVDKQDQLIALSHSLTGIQVDKQSQIITLLHQLTANTDEIEINTDGVETLLDNLTAITQNEFNETQLILATLTSIQIDKQDQVIGLLHSLTAKVLEVDINTDSLEINTDGLESLLEVNNSYLNSLTASNQKIAGFSIPPYDEISVDYITPTNNIKTVTYLNSSTIVLSLSFTYYPNPPTDDDALCVKIKKTI